MTGPSFPFTDSPFAAVDAAQTDDLLKTLRGTLTQVDARNRSEGSLGLPSVLVLALSIDSALRDGHLTPESVSACLSTLTREGLEARARTLAARLAPADDDDALCDMERLRAQIESLACPYGASSPVPFEPFREAVERFHYGFVLTAHPTFSLNPDQNRALSDLAWTLAAGRDCTQQRHSLWETLRAPFVPPNLDAENAQALEAARRIREAVATARRIALEVAARHYPREWTALRPALCSVATWVGFDLDGRSDIVWSGILARRLLLQTLQIEALIHYLDALPPLTQVAQSPVSQARACLNTALDQARGLRDLFASYDPDHDPDHAALQATSRAMIANAPTRMVRPDQIVTLLEEALALEPSPAGQTGLVGVLSALRAEGGTFAQVHFRVNAVQIHNAIRKHVDLTTHPADPRFRQTYLERIGRLLAGVRACPVHFGTILEEQASARRLFMIVQQIVKHVDATAPIRFLIAETESALTVLGALYLARRFGVEDHVDLCPLFETERALEDGAHIVQTLLESPDFVAWVRRRGRLCIQTGYSDAGRYIGQIPACGTIEQLKARIVQLMAARGLTDIDLVFFDTHGESIGRGGYPGSFARRLDYVSPPALRALAAREGVRLVQETSYQGGDGYLPFLNPDAAHAAVTRVITHILTHHEPGQTRPADDPYYEESGAITEFLTLIRQFQGALIDDPDYGALLSVFGPNLMRAAGSRALKRQHEGPPGVDRLLEARELRAIPHNAILAQMGVLVNSACGLGTAVSEDPDLFRRMTGRSDRFRALSAMGLKARTMSDPQILRAYILTLDPDLWLARQDSCARTDPAQAERHGAIAAHLEAHSPFVGLHRVFRMIRADFNALAPAVPEGEHTPLCESLSLLHALRIGLILRIFSLAMDIPDYSRMHDIPREALIQKVFRLDIPLVMRELDEIFPVHPRQETRADYGEPSAWSGEEKESYAVEHARIFRPIAQLYEMVQDTSAAIAHHIGFVG